MDKQPVGEDCGYGLGEVGAGLLSPRESGPGNWARREIALQSTSLGRKGRRGKRAAGSADGHAPGRAAGGERAADGASGHAAHFLSRLDRVERDEVDFALGLYRDPELVRMLLARAALPEGCDRAAISLDDLRKGPFLVVTRAGHFVTCLGRGMAPGSLPVVSRQKLEAALTVASDRRARSRALHDRVAVAGGSGELLARVLERSDWLSREEFVAISALQPLLAPWFLRLFMRTASELSEAQRRFAYVLPRCRLNRRIVPALRSYWKQLWSLGHLLTLSTMGERHWVVDLFEAMHEVPGLERLSFSWPLVRHGIAPLALRGAWAMGRAGKSLVGFYKGTFTAPQSPLALFDATLALGAIGLRNARSRAEIQKVMATAAARVDFDAPPPACSTVKEYCSALGGNYASVLCSVFDSTAESFDDYAVRVGQKAVAEKLDALPAGARRPFASPDEVPEGVARAAFFDLDSDYATDPGAAAFFLLRLGAAARARAEDFYYPEAVLPYLRRRWRPEHSVEMLTRVNRCFAPLPPRRVERAPKREACFAAAAE